MVDLGDGCQRFGLQVIVRSRSEAEAGVAAGTAPAARGRALATGPPALVRRRPGKGPFAALTEKILFVWPYDRVWHWMLLEEPHMSNANTRQIPALEMESSLGWLAPSDGTDW